MNKFIRSVGLRSRVGKDIGGFGTRSQRLHSQIALHPMVEAVSDLLKRLFRGFDGRHAMPFWNGTPLRLGSSGCEETEPPFTLVCRSPIDGSKTLSAEFINCHVFRGGQLVTISNIRRVMERARFELVDVEALRHHRALMLRHWVSRLERHHTQVLQYVSESTYRVWRLHMAACALEFESGEIGGYQVLASKRDAGRTSLPLTRRHIYP